MEKYVVFDVETPNQNEDRICSIGLACINDLKIIETHSYLVNPECEFDAVNVDIHGIYPEDVADAPTFPEVWAKIEPFFEQYIPAAHNASFDISVLKNTLVHYGISFDCNKYVDTLMLARNIFPDRERYTLSSLCQDNDIPLVNHDANSDANACARLLILMLQKEMPERVARRSKPEALWYRHHKVRLSEDSTAFADFKNMLSDIHKDGHISVQECKYLKLMLENDSRSEQYPYREILKLCCEVLEDGQISDEENDLLLQHFLEIIDPVSSKSSKCDSADYAGKSVCLTGDFDAGTRQEVTDRLTEMGLIVVSSVTKKTDVILVGNQGSEAWAAGNYGTKVKKAMELQAKGQDIRIIKEIDFF